MLFLYRMRMKKYIAEAENKLKVYFYLKQSFSRVIVYISLLIIHFMQTQYNALDAVPYFQKNNVNNSNQYNYKKFVKFQKIFTYTTFDIYLYYLELSTTDGAMWIDQTVAQDDARR